MSAELPQRTPYHTNQTYAEEDIHLSPTLLPHIHILPLSQSLPIHSPPITITGPTNCTTDTPPHDITTPTHIPPHLRIPSLPSQHGRSQTNKMLMQYTQFNPIKQKESKLHNYKVKKDSASWYDQDPPSTNSAIKLRSNSRPHRSEYGHSISLVGIHCTVHPIV